MSFRLKWQRLLLLVCLSLPQIALAITIGDYKSLGKDRGVVLVTQLDGATFLDVIIEISGVPTNYVLEQIGKDVVLIRITDERLLSESSLILVQVSSPKGSAKRLYSYSSRNAGASQELKTPEEVKKVEKIKEEKSEKNKNKIVLPSQPDASKSDEQVYQIIDGNLEINITAGITAIRTAVYELARAGNYNVLVLPGDEKILDQPLVSAVSSFEDLYEASEHKIKHIFIDDDYRLVRVLGKGINIDQPFRLDSEKTDVPDESEKDTTLVQRSVREIIRQYARANQLSLMVLPGDETILNQSVNDRELVIQQDLVNLAYEINAWVDIDETLGLIRLRSKYVN